MSDSSPCKASPRFFFFFLDKKQISVPFSGIVWASLVTFHEGSPLPVAPGFLSELKVPMWGRVGATRSWGALGPACVMTFP